MTGESAPRPTLAAESAAVYASWFECLADPTRVRLLHAVASARRESTVGELTEALGISQSTCSHHLRKLAVVGFVHLRKDRTSTLVSVNVACCAGLPHAADVVMGSLAAQARPPIDPPGGVAIRAMDRGDWTSVRHIYAEGIATRNATFETDVPSRTSLDAKWLPDHRWVAEVDGDVAGWAAVTPVSPRGCYAGVAETSLYVGSAFRGRGVGKALIHRQVTAADDGAIWTLQSAIFPENRASLALHHAAGFRTVGVRDRIAKLDGRWRDTIMVERRGPGD